jgi:ABC-type amino acid transport substrate-binding protein
MRGLLAAVVLWGLLPASPALSSDLREIQARGTLRILAVASDEETYFVSPRPGEAPGFDVEVLEGFARLHKLKVEVIPVSGWGALIPSLHRDKGDLIAGGFTDTESRRRLIDFTVEAFPTRSVAMTRRPAAAIQSVAELRGKRVGTVRGTFMEDELAAVGVTNVDSSIPSGGLPDALRASRVDVVVDGLEAALRAQAKDPDLLLGVSLGRPSSLAYGVRHQDQELLKALNEYLTNLRRTPTWSRLVVKYFGDTAVELLRKARTP